MFPASLAYLKLSETLVVSRNTLACDGKARDFDKAHAL